jgi:chaperonin cofactor prefoldin
MISEPSQTPDPLANNPEFSTSDVWADAPADEPEAEVVVKAVENEEEVVVNLSPSSEIQASVSSEVSVSPAEPLPLTDSVQDEALPDEDFGTPEAIPSPSVAEDPEVNTAELMAAPTPVEAIAPEALSRSGADARSRSGTDALSPEIPQGKAHQDLEDQKDRLAGEVAELQRQKKVLTEEILQLEANRGRLLQENIAELQNTLGQMIQESLGELQQRKQALQVSVEQLERRQERIRKEMQSTFAGVSQDLAIRVQGFKDYLVGSLQDLARAAEDLDMAPKERSPEPASDERSRSSGQPTASRPNNPEFGDSSFEEQAQLIRRILKQFRTQPDYYGPPWQLRRTFEPIHAERVSNWFFTQGGRGALRTMGSRLQNILVASAVMSCLRKIYGNRFRTLVLADSPERLGEWRRGLQDCLGISRSDFGPERGVVLFEDAEALSQKAERLIKDGLMPLVLIDETEGQINLGILQFPLWLAFAAEPKMSAPASSNW